VRRIATALAAAGLLLLAVASPAFAHVVISPPNAPKGSDALLTFVVANEEDNASTTKVEVTFPQDHPIAEALTTPMAGWTAKVTSKEVTTPIKTDEGEINEAVNTVTWTASAGGFGAGEFGSFAVSVGLPDDADALTFKVVQTYSNGTTVDWVDATVAGGDEPEHPAPVLTLTAGDGGTTATTAPAASTSSSDDDSNGLAIAALVVGGIAVIIAIAALVMGRQKSPNSAV
jgi:uncharacterized protein YcnI